MICLYSDSCVFHDKVVYILNSYFIDCKNAISHFNYSWDSYDYIVLLLEQLSDYDNCCCYGRCELCS